MGTQHLQLGVKDFLVHQLRVLAVERGQAGNHFVDKDAQRPPVHRLAVAVALEHLCNAWRVLAG